MNQTTTDAIEREIEIDAAAERVWELVARPGWWINDGTILELTGELTGEVNVIHHETYGDFRIKTVSLEPPRYAAFRWLNAESENESSPEGGSTLVEFWLEDREGGVTLRVVESGFASLNISDEKRRRNIDSNTEGWETELSAARSWATGK